MVSEIQDEHEKLHTLSCIVKAMARFFWFSIEFGLMRRSAESFGSDRSVVSVASNGTPPLCVYGSGLLSSYGEIEYCIVAPEVQRYPFQMEWVVNQYFEIDHYQPLLFYVDSFDHLFSLVDQLEHWMKEGRLSNVAPGEPEIGEADLKSFLDAGSA
jgi:phenylalanine-4-hydroxylase